MNNAHRVSIGVAAATALGVALAVGSIAVTSGQTPAAGQSQPPTASPVASTLSVEGAWARVSPMMDLAGAAYMVIHNAGAIDDALVAVTSPAAAVVELHQTAPNSSGEMLMQPVDSIPVPAGGTAELKPGSYHMMLIDLVAPLTEGTTIDLDLTFQSGTVLAVTVPVQAGMPMGSMASMAPMGSAAPMGTPAP